jgi:hypothetical protein
LFFFQSFASVLKKKNAYIPEGDVFVSSFGRKRPLRGVKLQEKNKGTVVVISSKGRNNYYCSFVFTYIPFEDVPTFPLQEMCFTSNEYLLFVSLREPKAKSFPLGKLKLFSFYYFI